jgi:hypothetical protein
VRCASAGAERPECGIRVGMWIQGRRSYLRGGCRVPEVLLVVGLLVGVGGGGTGHAVPVLPLAGRWWCAQRGLLQCGSARALP